MPKKVSKYWLILIIPAVIAAFFSVINIGLPRLFFESIPDDRFVIKSMDVYQPTHTHLVKVDIDLDGTPETVGYIGRFLSTWLDELDHYSQQYQAELSARFPDERDNREWASLVQIDDGERVMLRMERDVEETWVELYEVGRGGDSISLLVIEKDATPPEAVRAVRTIGWQSGEFFARGVTVIELLTYLKEEYLSFPPIPT